MALPVRDPENQVQVLWSLNVCVAWLICVGVHKFKRYACGAFLRRDTDRLTIGYHCRVYGVKQGLNVPNFARESTRESMLAAVIHRLGIYKNMRGEDCNLIMFRTCRQKWNTPFRVSLMSMTCEV